MFFEETSAILNTNVSEVFDNLLNCISYIIIDIIIILDIYEAKLNEEAEANGGIEAKKYKKL